LLIVAIVLFDEVHVAVVVKFFIELSLYVPVAVNWIVCPCGTFPGFGVTAREDNVGPVTVNVVLPLMFPEVAVIVVEPPPIAVARPGSIVATAVFDDVHVAVFVRSCMVPSL
jgi:hypothetical protein